MANKELFSLYEEMFDLHVWTKTNDAVFHKSSEAFYEALFNAAHWVDEAMQDSKQASPINPSEARKKSYVIMEKAKKIVEDLVNSNKDIAVDNVLRGIVDNLWFNCGNARAFAAWECPMIKDKKVEETTDEEEVVEDAAEDAEEQEEYEWMANTDEEVVWGPAYEEEDEDEKKKKKPVDVTMVEIIPE